MRDPLRSPWIRLVLLGVFLTRTPRAWVIAAALRLIRRLGLHLFHALTVPRHMARMPDGSQLVGGTM